MIETPHSERLASALGQIVFAGDGNTPGELLDTISRMREALEALEARYAAMVGRESRETRVVTQPAERSRRGRKPGSARRERNTNTPAPLPFGEPAAAREA
jgi:hypothetical protein